MRICPKCGYERSQEDDAFVSTAECPKCGVVYQKAAPLRQLGQRNSTTTRSPAKSNKIRFIIGAAIVSFVIGLLASLITTTPIHEEIEALADRACACSTAECADQVVDELQVLFEKGGRGDQQRANEALSRLADCAKKVATDKKMLLDKLNRPGKK